MTREDTTTEDKESQKELKVKDLEILKTESSGEMLETVEVKRTPQTRRPLNKSLSVSNVGNGGGKITGQSKSSNLTAKKKTILSAPSIKPG